MENRIKELREQKNMTQQNLAERARVSRQTIISLENGKYNPSIFLAYRIARIFGLSIEQVFLFGDDDL